MFPAPFRVVLDANVLYPFTLRDTLLRAADAGFFQVYWSAQILEEATRNLIANGVVSDAQAAHLITAMNDAFPEALVTDHESLIDSMKNDPKDRHAALPDGIEALHPDAFLLDLLDLDPDALSSLVRRQAEELKRPPRTFDEILDALAKLVPGFVAAVRARGTHAFP